MAEEQNPVNKPKNMPEEKLKMKTRTKTTAKLIIGIVIGVIVALGIGTAIFFVFLPQFKPKPIPKVPIPINVDLEKSFPSKNRDYFITYGKKDKYNLDNYKYPEGLIFDTEVLAGLKPIIKNLELEKNESPKVELKDFYGETFSENYPLPQEIQLSKDVCDKVSQIRIYSEEQIISGINKPKKIDFSEYQEMNNSSTAISHDSLSKIIPDSEKLEVKFYNKDFQELSSENISVFYQSSDPRVVWVYPGGYLFPISPGRAEIRATACDKTAVARVTVPREITKNGKTYYFKDFNPYGKFNPLKTGYAFSKTITTAPEGQYISEITLKPKIESFYWEIIPALIEKTEEEGLDEKKKFQGEVEILASNDGGKTWVRPEEKLNYQKKGTIEELKEGEKELHFEFKTKGGDLKLALKMTVDFDQMIYDNPGKKIIFSTGDKWEKSSGNSLPNYEIHQLDKDVNKKSKICPHKKIPGLLLVENITKAFKDIDTGKVSIIGFDSKNSSYYKNIGLSSKLKADADDAIYYKLSDKYEKPIVISSKETRCSEEQDGKTTITPVPYYEIESIQGVSHDQIKMKTADNQSLQQYLGALILPSPSPIVSGLTVSSIEYKKSFSLPPLIRKFLPENKVSQVPGLNVNISGGGTKKSSPPPSISRNYPWGKIGPNPTVDLPEPKIYSFPPRNAKNEGTSPSEERLVADSRIVYRGHNRVIVKWQMADDFKNINPDELEFKYGEKGNQPKWGAKVYKDDKDKETPYYTVLTGLKGGEWYDKNDQGYKHGRYTYDFQISKKDNPDLTYKNSFKTLNRMQTIVYYYRLVLGRDYNPGDRKPGEEEGIYENPSDKRFKKLEKGGLLHWYKPEGQESLSLAGIKFSLINDRLYQEFEGKLKGIEKTEDALKFLYFVIHDRIYPDPNDCAGADECGIGIENVSKGKYYDPKGLNYWKSIVESGVHDISGIKLYMLLSPEYQENFMAGWGLSEAGKVDPAKQAEAKANLAYQIVLKRGADQKGVNYLLANFKSSKDMRKHLLNSKEAKDRLAKIEKDVSKEQALRELYEMAYARPADLEGLKYWLDSGLTIQEIKGKFITSKEFEEVLKD